MARALLATCVWAALAWTTGAASAATYYVDFDGGKDANDGLSAQAPLKHCPGDPLAADRTKAVQLAPGDTVIFKGGVLYRGQVSIGSSGAQGKPIVYDGNTAGTFGEGRALVDGSEPITGWRRCASAEECGGNPNWKNIYVATVPDKLTFRTINLCDAENTLSVAQDPNPADPFFEDVIDTWQPVVDPKPAAACLIRITKGKGMSENSTRPYILMVDGKSNTSAVIDPCAGAELTFELPGKVTAAKLAMAASTYYQMPKDVVFLADGKEVLRATLEKKSDLQTFDLPEPATFRTLTLKIISAYEHANGYGAIISVEALDAQGKNLMQGSLDMSYADAAYFTQTDPHFWDGGTFVLYGRPNMIYYQKVLGYDPAAHRLTFELTTAGQYEDTGRFSMMNVLGILDRPGEFVLAGAAAADGTRKLYVWPLGDAGPEGITYSARNRGFELSGAAWVVIRGFHVQKQGSASVSLAITGSKCDHVEVLDNEVTMVRTERHQIVGFSESTHCTIRGNNIHHNRRCGAVNLNKCTDCEISHNIMHKNGATGLVLYGSTNILVARNTVTDHKGMHANGLTAYLWCKNVTFEGNRVSGGNVALTLQQGDGILVRNNIFDGGETTMCVGVWNTDDLKNVRFLNNCFVRASRDVDWSAGIYWGGKNENAVGYVMKNNVIDGTSASRKSIPVERSHNVYTRRRWCEADERGWKPTDGETVETDLAKLFVDPEHGDWRPKPGGPLIDTGVDVGVAEDIVGTPVPQGAAPDIGAYELKP